MSRYNYYKRAAALALRDPLKIPGLLRLRFMKTDEWRKDYSASASVKVSAPVVIAIRMNYSCNLRCVMCNQWGENGVFVKDPSAMVKRDMTLEDMKAFIDDVAAFRPYLYFTGGEPLMNKDIIEVVRYASSKHLVTSMSTNGTYLKEKAEDLIKAGLDYLYTSLDAAMPLEKGVIRKDPRGEDSSAEAVEAIKHVVSLRDQMKAGGPLVQVQSIIVQENHDKLYELAKFVDEYLRADVWGLQPCVYTTPELNEKTSQTYREKFGQDQVQWAGFIRDFPDMDFQALEEQIRLIRRGRWRFKLRLYRPIGSDNFNFERYYTQPELHASAEGEEQLCMNPWTFAQLQPNGEIAFCGSQPDYTIGNVKTSRFMDLWCGERATQWRAFIAKRELFASCKRCFALYEFNHFKKD